MLSYTCSLTATVGRARRRGERTTRRCSTQRWRQSSRKRDSRVPVAPARAAGEVRCLHTRETVGKHVRQHRIVPPPSARTRSALLTRRRACLECRGHPRSGYRLCWRRRLAGSAACHPRPRTRKPISDAADGHGPRTPLPRCRPRPTSPSGSPSGRNADLPPVKVLFHPWLEVKRAQKGSLSMHGRCRDGGVGRRMSCASGRLRPVGAGKYSCACRGSDILCALCLCEDGEDGRGKLVRRRTGVPMTSFLTSVHSARHAGP
jgi:hypothetical protein